MQFNCPTETAGRASIARLVISPLVASGHIFRPKTHDDDSCEIDVTNWRGYSTPGINEASRDHSSQLVLRCGQYLGQLLEVDDLVTVAPIVVVVFLRWVQARGLANVGRF